MDDRYPAVVVFDPALASASSSSAWRLGRTCSNLAKPFAFVSGCTDEIVGCTHRSALCPCQAMTNPDTDIPTITWDCSALGLYGLPQGTKGSIAYDVQVLRVNLANNMLGAVTTTDLVEGFGPRITDLDLGNNVLTQVPMLNFQWLWRLVLTENLIGTLPALAFAGLPMLTELNLQRNTIWAMSPFAFAGSSGPNLELNSFQNPTFCHSSVGPAYTVLCVNNEMARISSSLRMYFPQDTKVERYFPRRDDSGRPVPTTVPDQKYSSLAILDRLSLEECMRELSAKLESNGGQPTTVSLVCDVLDDTGYDTRCPNREAPY